MKRPIFLLLALFATLCGGSAYAGIASKINFESGMPHGFSCGEGGEISVSGLHFKDGRQSLRWKWTSPSELSFSDYPMLKRSFATKGAGVMMWIYNTSPVDADLRFSFDTPTGETPYRFDFHMDFTGWRACWIKYADMPGDHSSKDIMTMRVETPEGAAAGEIFIDRMTFADFKLHAQITPDMQIPDNNCNLKRTLWHWARLWEWEQYEYAEPLEEVTPERHAMLEYAKSNIEDILTATMSSLNYINGTIIPRALTSYEKLGIRYNDDGTIVGAPLLSNDECNLDSGEIRFYELENMLYAFALNSYMNGDSKYDDDFFRVFDYAIDQGFAFGHGNGTNHHYGYSTRKIYDAAWLMRDKIAERGKTDEYVKVLAYWSGLAETRRPYVYGRDELLDAWHVLLVPKLVSALMLPTEAEQYRAMKALGVWLSGSLDYTPGTIGGIKPDGSTFHHGGLYPAYSVGAFASIGFYCKATLGTDFAVSEQGRMVFKHALLAMDRYSDFRDWGIGLAGRHPLSKINRIPDADVNAFGYVAAQGDLTGGGKGVDPDLAGAYLRLKGTDRKLNAMFKKEGISASPAPEGFFAMNYGAAGIHRRGKWMVTLKAYNSDVWCSEIYAKDNRYGRYQSYGTAPILCAGNPVTAAESGFVQDGWDWNRMPGATTIHLPWELLDSPLPGTLMARNPIRFSGVSSLEGRNGAMAFRFTEGSYKNFTEGATARKSVFCFDNRMVFLGSGITNSNSAYPTETTLFQLHMDDTAEQMEVDGEMIDAFPFNTVKTGDRVVLSDTKWNYYVVRGGSVNVVRQHQTSPNDKTRKAQQGNFATAYIDHGTAPSGASYEYSVYVQPSNKEISRLARKDFYEVLRRDDAAHVVRDSETGITGYVCFEAYEGEGTVRGIDAETIVMERTDADGTLIMSVCTPDLGLTEKSYTTRQESQPIIKRVTLAGSWGLRTPVEGVSLASENGVTVVSATCLHGLPVEMKLEKR